MKADKVGKSVVWILVLVVAAGLAVFWGACQSSTAKQEFVLEGEFGRAPEIYRRQCSVCHGVEGFGDGKAAYLIHPRPRDFSYGKFLLVSTDNRVPTDEDLFNTISRGAPGSAMPPWEHLPEQDRRDLVRYIRALTHHGKVLRLMGLKQGPVAAGHEDEQAAFEPMSRQQAEEVATYQLEVGEPLELPPTVQASDELRERGQKVFLKICAKCHGKEGKGDGSQVMEDDLGFRAFPRDFTKGIFKGGVEPQQLAYRILGGMPGSAMPSTDFDNGEDLWGVVDYTLSLVEPGAQEKVRQHRLALKAERAGGALSDDPLDPSWEKIKPTYVALMPLWWRDDRVEGVNVRAAYDDENLAIQLSWEDPSEDTAQVHLTQFGDAAAVELSSDEDPPFFGMGDEAGMVNIWHWKGVWEADRKGFGDITTVYPRGEMDSERAVRHFRPSSASNLAAEIDERDPAFYGGWGAGNLLSNPEHPSSVEDLNAKGLGTVHSQALRSQNVRGNGVWRDGVWRVVLMRSLSTGQDGDIEFQAGQTVRIAFAIWDGRAGDRNGQKSVTIWHDLSLEQ